MHWMQFTFDEPVIIASQSNKSINLVFSQIQAFERITSIKYFAMHVMKSNQILCV